MQSIYLQGSKKYIIGIKVPFRINHQSLPGMMRKFLAKYYPPWSLLWVFQRVIIKIQDHNFHSLVLKTLWNDYKLHEKTKRSIRERSHWQSNKDETGRINTEYTESAIGPPQMICEEIPLKDLSFVNTYFDHVYVINLQKRQDRLAKISNALTSLKIKAEIFQAVDGYNSENLEEFEKYYHSPVDPVNAHELELKLKRKVIYSPGAWGTLKTYQRLLKDAKEKHYKRILSLEDDVLFAINFEMLFKNAVLAIPDTWKLLYLGASQHSWEKNADIIYPEITQGHEAPGYYHPVDTDGAFAIGIDSSVFDLLIREIEKMNCSFDSGPLRQVCHLNPSECFVLQPNIIIADVTDSDISLGRNMVNFAKIARWDLRLFDYRA